MSNTEIKVLVVEDHTLFAQGTASLLSSVPGITVAGIASTAGDCLQQIKDTYPHIVLLDINLPDSCGVNAIGKIKKEKPDINIIMLTGQNPEGYVNSSLAQGALGFLLKDCSKDEMVAAIRKVAMGETYFSHSMSHYLKSAITNQKEEFVITDSDSDSSPAQTDLRDDYIASLTARESEVLELIAEGLCNREMAQRLQITTRTVEYHVANIMEKLGAKSRLEAVVIYMNNANRQETV